MKIDDARAMARLYNFLSQLNVISENRCIQLVNYLTVKSIHYQMKEKSNAGSSNKNK